MTTFSLTGQRGDRYVTVTWADGKLSGDADAIEMLQLIVEAYGPLAVHELQSNPYVACRLIRSMFKRGAVRQEGSLPEIKILLGAVH